ncbi:sulfate transporter [Crotalus adamanteus]|uniref:Sulfate transporter n=1 Tax=Crotalus adamanteus TaxID=8729 RepID=A0AAW1BX53_CROAD
MGFSSRKEEGKEPSYFGVMESGTVSQKSENSKDISSLPSSQSSQLSSYTPVKLEEYETSGFSIKKLLTKAKENCNCNQQSVLTFFHQLFPVTKWLPCYNIKEDLLGDVISGLLVGVVSIPQSISYAILASQDPIYGLYTNFFCAIIYFAMATSRHNCVGSFGVLCLMIGQSVNRQLTLAGYDLDMDTDLMANATMNGTVTCNRGCYAITVATTLTFLVGLYQIILGVFQLGFISVYLSEPLLKLGLLIGVCFALLCIIFRTQRPRATLLGKVNDSEIYEDQFIYKRISSIANIKIFRFDTSLYYANKDYFKSSLFQKTGVNPGLVASLRQKAQAKANLTRNQSCFSSKFNCLRGTKTPKASADAPETSIDMHTLIIDCGAMQFIDSVGLSLLKEMRQDYKKIGIQVLLANCNPSIRRLLQAGGWLTGMQDPELLSFHSIHAAVQFAEKQDQTQQTDSVAVANVFGPETEDVSIALSLEEPL